jgi:hypothetical protein
MSMKTDYKLLADWLHQIDMDKEPVRVVRQSKEDLIRALKECCRELRIENIKLRKENRRLKNEI